MKLYLNSLLWFLFISLSANGQPANNDCTSATSLTFGSSCVLSSFDGTNATNSSEPNAPCGFYNGQDVWFSFTAPSTGMFVVESYKGTNTRPVVSLYKGSCGSLIQVDCSYQNNTESNGYARIITNDSSLGGQTIFVRVAPYNNGSAGTFEICIYEVTNPANDFCANAISLGTPGPTCTQTTYTNEYGTSESSIATTNCGFYKNGDVWFTLTVPSSGHLVIDAYEGTNNSPVLNLYSGTCNNLTQIACESSGSPTNDGRIVLHDASLGGTVLYLRVFKFNNYNGGTFDLCLFEPTIPDNDFCAEAIDLGTPTATCTNLSFNNSYCTKETNLISPTCGAYKGGDVWFTLTVPSSGHLVIDGLAGTNTNPVTSIYTGSCNSLVAYDCRSTDSPTNDGRIVIHDESLAGQSIYLRVFQWNSVNGGSFDLCLFESAPPDNDFCIAAVDLGTPTPTCTQQSFDNTHCTRESAIANPGCGAYKGGDTWFVLTMPASGHLAIDALAGTNINPVTSLYTGGCSGLTEYDCRYSSSPTNDGRIIVHDESLAGQSLYLRIASWNKRNGGTFDLCLFEPPIPDNDSCNAAIDLGLPSGPDCNAMTYTNAYCTDDPANTANPTCSAYKGGDVWFTVTMPASGHLWVEAVSGDNINPTVTIYSGTCGTLMEVECRSSGSTSNDGRIVLHDVSLAGQTFYIRASTWNSRNGGTFTLCVAEPDIPDNDHCLNAYDIGTPSNNCTYTAGSNILTTDSPYSGPSCGAYKGSDIWYTLTVPSGGKFIIDTERNQNNRIVVAAYTGVCGSLTEYDCSYTGSPNDNSGYLVFDDVSLAGQVLFIRFSVWNRRTGVEFEFRTFLNENIDIRLKAQLGGPFDDGTQLMKDDLRAAGLVPVDEPFSDLGFTFVNAPPGDTLIDPSILVATGNDAIVDWVFLVLYSIDDPNDNIIEARPCLIQRDGDVVELDGVTPVSYFLNACEYNIGLFHRNHLGVKTERGITTANISGISILDFSDPLLVVEGNMARQIVGSTAVMWPGDATNDGAIDAADRSAVWNGRNQNGYLLTDVNLDGACDAADRSIGWNHRNQEGVEP